MTGIVCGVAVLLLVGRWVLSERVERGADATQEVFNLQVDRSRRIRFHAERDVRCFPSAARQLGDVFLMTFIGFSSPGDDFKTLFIGLSSLGGLLAVAW